MVSGYDACTRNTKQHDFIYNILENESLSIRENPLDPLLSISSSSSSKAIVSTRGSLRKILVYARFGRGAEASSITRPWGSLKIRENCAGFALTILENDFGPLRIREKEDDPPFSKPRRILENDPGRDRRILEKEDVGDRKILENDAPLKILL